MIFQSENGRSSKKWEMGHKHAEMRVIFMSKREKTLNSARPVTPKTMDSNKSDTLKTEGDTENGREPESGTEPAGYR